MYTSRNNFFNEGRLRLIISFQRMKVARQRTRCHNILVRCVCVAIYGGVCVPHMSRSGQKLAFHFLSGLLFLYFNGDTWPYPDSESVYQSVTSCDRVLCTPGNQKAFQGRCHENKFKKHYLIFIWYWSKMVQLLILFIYFCKQMLLFSI